MTAAAIAVFLAALGFGIDAVSHTQQLQTAMHQVVDTPPGVGQCQR